MTFKGPRQTMLRSFQRRMTLTHWPILFFDRKRNWTHGRSDLYSYSFPPFLAVFFSWNELEYWPRYTLELRATHSLSSCPSFKPLSERRCVKKLFLTFDTSLLYDWPILRPRYLMSGYMATTYPHYFPVPWARGKLHCRWFNWYWITERQEKHGF